MNPRAMMTQDDKDRLRPLIAIALVIFAILASLAAVILGFVR